MNQDQVKEKLLALSPSREDFTIIFSGKESSRANGVYHPEKHEIILHNKNFANDDALMYTAIHEYAHHLHFTESAVPVGHRAHTTKFWSLFHSLLFKAEEMGLYINIFESDEAFLELTRRIREDYLAKNGQIIRDFGKILVEAEALCSQHGQNFMDYLDRILRIPRQSASSMMKSHVYQLEPALGYDNMKTLTGIRDTETRAKAQDAMMEGLTPAMVKEQFSRHREANGEIEQLRTEKLSIERRINDLADRLRAIEARLRDAEFRSIAREPS